MKEIKRDNAIIDYEVSGNAPISLVFVHGSYIDQTYWKNQLDYFNFNYKVVTLDLPGHGKSGYDRELWSVKGFAEDVIEVIKELDLKNVILVGHSLGANVSLIAATLYPQPLIGFIAIDNFKNAGIPLAPEFQQQVSAIEKNLETDFARTNENYARMALLTKETPKEIADRVVLAYRNAYHPMAIATTPEIFSMSEVERDLLPKLKFKLHLINVDYIPTNENGLKEFAKQGYEIFHMKGTSHYPMLENPDGLNDLLQKAIDNISRDNGLV